MDFAEEKNTLMLKKSANVLSFPEIFEVLNVFLNFIFFQIFMTKFSLFDNVLTDKT